MNGVAAYYVATGDQALRDLLLEAQRPRHPWQGDDPRRQKKMAQMVATGEATPIVTRIVRAKQ